MIQREKPKPAKASQARQRKRPLPRMAQLRGDFGGRAAHVFACCVALEIL